MMDRGRFKHTETLEQRLAAEAARLREEAKLLPPGAVRDLAEVATDRDSIAPDRMAEIAWTTTAEVTQMAPDYGLSEVKRPTT
jgi:hypothetical protein